MNSKVDIQGDVGVAVNVESGGNLTININGIDEKEKERQRAISILESTCKEAKCESTINRIAKKLYSGKAQSELDLSELDKLQFIASEFLDQKKRYTEAARHKLNKKQIIKRYLLGIMGALFCLFIMSLGCLKGFYASYSYGTFSLFNKIISSIDQIYQESLIARVLWGIAPTLSTTQFMTLGNLYFVLWVVTFVFFVKLKVYAEGQLSLLEKAQISVNTKRIEADLRGN